MPHVLINNINFYYEDHNPDREEVLFFIHGLGSSSKDWEMQVPFFQTDYRLILLDLRGHGNSDKPEGPYSMDQFSEDIVAFMEKLQIPNATIVGISLGGMVAFELVNKRPDLVKNLIIVNSTNKFKLESALIRFQLQLRKLFLRIFGFKTLAKFLAWKLFPGKSQRPLRKKFMRRWIRNNVDAYKNSFSAITSWQGMEALELINCPSLVITGDKDYWPVQEKESYVKRIPKAILKVIKHSTHATPIDQAEQFNMIISEFLQNQVAKNK